MENRRFLLYKGPHHAANLNNMRVNNKCCDVTIKVNDRDLRAHKVVLAANLQYFESKLSYNPFAEVIAMESVEGADLEEFIFYAYTGEILLTDSNALGLLEVANHLKEDDIKKTCIEFLENHLRDEDALRAYKLADDIECHTLKNTARRAILSNFQNCSLKNEYLDLDFECLRDVLAGVRFDQADESQQMFFEGIAGWLRRDLESRRGRANDLLDLIDVSKLTDDFRRDFDFDEITKDMVFGESRETKHQLDFPRAALMVLGDVNLEPHFQFYDFAERKWSSLQQIPDANRMYSNGAVLNDKLYYICRNFGKSHLQVYNLRTNRSMTLYSSSSVLSWSSVCACSDFIYLCGGKEFVVEFNQVLKYIPIRNSFETLPPMTTKRSHAVAIFYQGCLHVVGGRKGSQGVTSVEKYDAATKNWTKIASMCEGRYGHAVAVLQGKLYACGGLHKNSVEVYDPSLKSWRLVASMNRARYHFFAIARKEKLLAVGGDRDEMTVEVYDPLENQWRIDQQLSSGLQISYPRGGFIHR